MSEGVSDQDLARMLFRVRWRGKTHDAIGLDEIRSRLSEGTLSLAHEVETDKGWITVEELLAAYETRRASTERRQEDERVSRDRHNQLIQTEQKALLTDYEKALDEERARRTQLEADLQAKEAKPLLRSPVPTSAPANSKSIYISKNGKQEGPYCDSELRDMLAYGSIPPSALAWKEGMADWLPIRQVLGGPPPPPKFFHKHAYAHGHSSDESTATPGFGRLGYFLATFFLALLGVFLGAGLDEGSAAIVTLIVLAVVFVPTVYRLQHIGYSGWMSLLLLLPLVNLFISAMCLIVPGGYAQSKKLDTPGIVMLSIALVFLLLALIGLIFTSI